MKKFIFYPYLFAVFPVLFLYTHNIKETRLSQALPALAISLVFCLFLWGIFLLILKDKSKAGIVTSVFILIFFSYGHLYDQLYYLTSGLNLGEIGHCITVPLFLALWLVIFWFLLRTRKNFHAATYFLNIMALSLVLINIFNIVIFETNRGPVAGSKGKNGHLAVDKTTIRPDVYFIIMDEYAGLESIKKLYNYDNSEFVNELQKRGFQVAEKCKTRYTASEQCMASVLNMRFLEKGEEPYQLIRDSQVSQLFKEQGYKIFIFPINSQAVFKNSDRVCEFIDPWLNDFNLTLLKTTMLRFLAEAIIENNDYGQHYRDKILYIFEELKQLTAEKIPKFVYCHILCPHAPFVFDAGGGAAQPGNFLNLKDKKYYLDQYKFMNKKLLETVDKLLHQPAVPPVIIIQSDHGQRGTMGTYHMAVGQLWQDIFSAYYLPGVNTKELPSSFPPVNTFRLIFNIYFQGNFLLLN